MPKVILKNPDGLVVENRLAKPGQVVELDHATALEFVRKGAAIMYVRIRTAKGLMIDSTWHPLAAVVEVEP
ncbi:hypothetical protein ACYOEI_40995, partial [Singulisphaera rosea]